MSITDNKYNLTMWQGSTFSFEIVVNDSEDKPEDLTGFIARMQIRPSYKSSTIIESLSSSTGEITIDGTNGKLSVALSAARTAAVKVNMTNGKPPRTVYVYDLEIEDSTQHIVSKILWGDITVYGEVTR